MEAPMPILIFCVTEEEYPKLQKVCPTSFPIPSYERFLKYIDKIIRQLPQGAPVEKIHVKIDSFVTWCSKAGIHPDNHTARAAYLANLYTASHIVSPSSDAKDK